jgi:radical SAM protein with 4Fe4S-binding SPASM domain
MSLTSGSHPKLYKAGMKLAKMNPALFDFGWQMLSFPRDAYVRSKLALGDKGQVGKIQSVNLEVTIRCNLRCTFCWWWGEKGIAYDLAKNKDPMLSKELSKEEIFDIVDQLAAKHMCSFYLSGGEPFLREDMVDIIEYITGKGMSVATNNNGTMLSEEKMQRLAKMKMLTINFSIDGPKEVHDKIRGDGNFEKTTKNMKRLIELRGDSMFPAIKSNTTFSPWIVGRMDEMIKYLQDDVGVDATRLTHLWFTDKEHADKHKAVLKSLFGTNETGVDSHLMGAHDPSYIKALADEIGLIEKSKYSKPVFIHPRMSNEQIQRYYSDLDFSKRRSCVVAWDSILIKADGDVMFCPDEWMNDFKLGNVRDSKIDEMWTGEQARKFRKALYKSKLFPACAKCCAINF